MSAHRATDRCLEDPEWLVARYVADRLTCAEIAALAGVSRATVQRRLAEHDIARRGTGEANIVHHQLHDPAWVARAVVDRGLSPAAIRAEVGAGEHAVRDALARTANVAAITEAARCAEWARRRHRWHAARGRSDHWVREHDDALHNREGFTMGAHRNDHAAAGTGAGLFDDVPAELAELMAGLDWDIVQERSLLWRAITARGCRLEADTDAEDALANRLAASGLLAQRSPSVWGSLVANLANRAERAGWAPDPSDDLPDLLAAAGSGGERVFGVIAALAADDDPTRATTAAAGRLCEQIASAEGLDETPATVAAWAVADVSDNLDVWAMSICDAAADGRADLAAAALAGLVLAFSPSSEPIRDLDVWLAELADESPGVVPSLSFDTLEGYASARAALGVRGARVADVAGTHGWLPTGWAIGALVVETATEVAAHHQHVGLVLRELLAGWPVLSVAAA